MNARNRSSNCQGHGLRPAVSGTPPPRRAAASPRRRLVAPPRPGIGQARPPDGRDWPVPFTASSA